MHRPSRRVSVAEKTLIAGLLLILFLPAAAVATPLTALYVFGDSLSDQGNAYSTTGGFPPSPYAQRASNGPVAAEMFASRLGVPLVASQSGGTNYAYVGALTGPTVVPGTSPPVAIDNYAAAAYGQPALFGTGILNQVASFIGSGPVFDPNGALFFVWGGPNDFFVDPSAATAASAVNNLAGAISLLYGAGARHFFVPNMPDLSLTPYGLGLPPLQRAGLQALSVGFDDGLATALGSLAGLPGIDITGFDTFTLLATISANPAAFGFTNAQDPCITGNLGSGGTVCASPDTYVFWDSVHPTTAAHAVLASAFADAYTAVPQPTTLLLLGAGIAAAALVAARRRGSREVAFIGGRRTINKMRPPSISTPSAATVTGVSNSLPATLDPDSSSRMVTTYGRVNSCVCPVDGKPFAL
ncbi:MAG TPA: SGNH/GDSL hydrolase family protein [Candidatus Bathyarchaeia archaeon]|nr:SGNH/GDSL hydrolase family protein [Candidatus Bathyarchaeia archaeon]